MRFAVLVEGIRSEGRDGYYFVDVSVGFAGQSMERHTFLVQVVYKPAHMLVFHDSGPDDPGFYTFTRRHPGTRYFSDLIFRFHEGEEVRFPVDM